MAAGIRTPNLPLAGRTHYPIVHPLRQGGRVIGVFPKWEQRVETRGGSRNYQKGVGREKKRYHNMMLLYLSIKSIYYSYLIATCSVIRYNLNKFFQFQ